LQNRFLPDSEFLQYLAACSDQSQEQVEPQLPSLNELSKSLGISVSTLREQLEVARALGLVEVRPRTGIKRLPYSFQPAVQQSLFYALSLDPGYFSSFSTLRNHIEASFWHEAVEKLQTEDIASLENLLQNAWLKLNGTPIQIPHEEHRLLHLTIFSRLENPFVQGILEAYWQAYEAVGLNVYTDYQYLQQVWTFHQRIVESIRSGDFESGYHALVDHKDLLHHRLSGSRTNPEPIHPLEID
jgi:DNA-binding FadR family transcriptional regulator